MEPLVRRQDTPDEARSHTGRLQDLVDARDMANVGAKVDVPGEFVEGSGHGF